MKREERVVMIGGGLAGGLLAAMLGRQGLSVDLYERRPDPAAGNLVGGRSINLAISVRGLYALAQVGLEERVLSDAIPMRGRMIHLPDGTLRYQPYDKDPRRCIYSIGRGALNRATIDAARAEPSVRVHFDRRCVDVDLQHVRATLADPADQLTDARGELLIGVDGAYSAVRRAMQRHDRFDYSQTYLPHGYKELTIPPLDGGRHAMEREVLHIWPRRSFMMIALPNPDGSFTCTLFYPFEGPESFARLQSAADMEAFVGRQFPDAAPLMPTLAEDFQRNPTGSMVTVRCAPWVHGDRIALLGDAAHAVVPFYGQGANAAFEDCVELAACLREFAPDWGVALRTYDARRRASVDALADLALANFIEMRDKTGARPFRLYKSLERALHTLTPQWFTPLYTMVSFTRTPYDAARRRARLQDRVVLAAALSVLALALGGLLLALPSTWTVVGVALLALLGAAAGLSEARRARTERQTLRAIGARGV